MTSEDESPSDVNSHRAQIVVALIAAGALVIASFVTSGFGLLSDGGSAPGASVSANGGNSKNSDACVAGGVVVQGTVNCASVTKEPSGQLRAEIVPADPGVFQVAFDQDIGRPAENTGWQELHDQGGVDVYDAAFNVTLANRSERPVTIRDIHTEVIGSDPVPTAALAYVYTQGDGPVSQFAARITSAEPKARSQLYKVVDGQPGWASDPPADPFFTNNYISLRPGEIYEATIGVQTDLQAPRMVEYRFVISGSTPERSFTIRDQATARISGLIDSSDAPRYEHYYVDGYLAHAASSTCPGLEVKQWFAQPPGGVTTPCP